MSASRTRIVCLPLGYFNEPRCVFVVLITPGTTQCCVYLVLLLAPMAAPQPQRTFFPRPRDPQDRVEIVGVNHNQYHSMWCTTYAVYAIEVTCHALLWEGILGRDLRPDQGCPQACSASNIGPVPPGVQAHHPQHRGRRPYPRPAASNLFSYPDLFSKLAKNPRTAPLFSGPAFAFKLLALQANPRDMGERSSPGIERSSCRGERVRDYEHARQDFGGALSAAERGEQ
ncbi:unnamed protein product [Tilletia controversa]|nr:unnamed protein product [Tilletia controversa]CAD6983668.1 unnamed protein product [Tilletia controversa]